MRIPVWSAAVVLFLVVGGGVLFLTMRGKGYTDATRSMRYDYLPLPEKYYFDLAWVNEHQIAVNYGEPGTIGPGHTHIVRYDLRSQAQQSLTPNAQEICAPADFIRLRRLPDGTLGVILDCFKDGVRQAQLFQLDPASGDTTLLYRYTDRFAPAIYSFSPDMTRFLQSKSGGMRNNVIYLVDERGEMEQLFTEHPHTRGPSWSPDGSSIALFAILGDPEADQPDPRLRGISTITAEWDLVLAEADTFTSQPVLPGIQFPQRLQWVANQNKVMFAGIYHGTPGIWLFDFDQQQLTRLWPDTAVFAVSPDARSVILVDQDDEASNSDEWRRLVLLELDNVSED